MKLKIPIKIMIFLLVVCLPGVNLAGTYGVTGVRVESHNGLTRLIIEAGGAYTFNDFYLGSPPRIAVDFKAAIHLIPGQFSKEVNRGGVIKIRNSQFREDTVRVTFVLSDYKAYVITENENNLVIEFKNTDGIFDPWNSAESTRETDSGAESIAAAGTEDAPTDYVDEAPADLIALEKKTVKEASRISVDFEDANIKVVLRAFADFSGQSIVAGRTVTGRVTARISDIPWDQALDMILRSQGYGYEYRSGIYAVDRLENLRATEKLEGLDPKVFNLNYLIASDALPTVERMLSDRGTASLDEKTNSLIVTDVPSRLEEIALVLPQLDRQTRQVTIKSRLVFINTVDLNQIGVSWKVGDMNNPRVDVHGEASTSGARLSDPFLQLALGTMRSGVNVTGLLQALQEKQLVDVQAQPQITTLNNLQAEVFVGERTPIRVLDVGAETNAAATIQLIETGIRLTVTPHITNNDKIVMELKAERSQAVTDPSEFGVKFQTQEGRTTLLVDNGQTAVIGGLTTQDSVENQRSIPYLSSVPLIGRFFRFKSVSTEKKDLLILVTPYIVSDLAENIE